MKLDGIDPHGGEFPANPVRIFSRQAAGGVFLTVYFYRYHDITSNSAAYGTVDLEQESGPVLDGFAVLVGSGVSEG